jgi:hypothetical protein
MRQRQVGISLPAGLRAKLDDAAARSGISLAEEVRRRLFWTFAERADPVQTVSAEMRVLIDDAWMARAEEHADG